MRDLKSRMGAAASVAPAARTATVNGTGVDLANTDAALVIIQAGTITDGTHTPKLQESADNAAWNDVAATDQIGALAAITANSVQRASYIGTKRYLRVVVTVAGATTGGLYSAVVLTGGVRVLPAA